MSRDDGVKIYRLEECKREAMNSIEEGFKVRGIRPFAGNLDRARHYIENFSM